MKQREKLWTPGPWWIEQETGDVVAKDGDWEICTFSRSDSQSPYDTQLISAAPDLVEALEDCLALWGDFLPPGNSNAMKAFSKARKALSKAYGDSQ